ncbi:MAG: hypothetical protein MAG794_01599 [Gammaproteobacteria bacterium]|nr:hypothetical protein [Gammaproteobacteria bacterium]
MSVSLSELRADTIEAMRRGGGSRPDVLRVRCHNGEAVLKDQNGCDRAFARLLGPLLARREARALRGLDDVPGVPALLGRPDKRSVLMEYIPSTPITRASHNDWPEFFAALECLLDTLHTQGIAHCDLRSPNNTLVGEAGKPVLVDFVASVRRGRSWNPVSIRIFDLFCRVDKKAVIKLKSIVAPELVTPDERHLLRHRSPLHRAIRRLGIGIRNVARGLFTLSSNK